MITREQTRRSRPNVGPNQIRRPEELRVGMAIAKVALGAPLSERLAFAGLALAFGSNTPGEPRLTAVRNYLRRQDTPQWWGVVQKVEGSEVTVAIQGQAPEDAEPNTYLGQAPQALPDVQRPTFQSPTFADLGLEPLTASRWVERAAVGRWLPAGVVQLS